MTTFDYPALKYYRCHDRGKHRAMRAQRRGPHRDVGREVTEKELRSHEKVISN